MSSARDTTLYYRETLAAARVVSRVSAMFIDSVLLPINMTTLIDFVDHTLDLSVAYLEEHISADVLQSKKGNILYLFSRRFKEKRRCVLLSFLI